MNGLIKYMQLQQLNIDDASLNELCTELLNQLINSPDIIGKTFQLYQYNNINFATEKINANIKPVWEKSSDGNFILTGFSNQNTQKLLTEAHNRKWNNLETT